MPTTPRKSSLGGISRRGPLKAHIPYRGDNPEVGKKTGITVQHVERQSDGFEPFDQILQQADGRTPPRPKGRKKSLAAITPTKSVGRPMARTSEVEVNNGDYGDYGEESMELASPARSASHRRPVARTSVVEVDNADPFDDYAPQEGQPSFGRIEAEEDEEEDRQEEEEEDRQEEEEEDRQGEDAEDRQEDEEEYGQEEEEDRQEEEVELPQHTPSKHRLDEEEEQEPQPPVKKAKTEGKKPQKSQTQSRTKKENRSPRQGVRKSMREHYKPLEYWRGEKLVYGRTRNSGPILVPQIKEIIRIPKEIPVPLGSKSKRGATRTRMRSQSKALEAVEDVIPPALPVVNPEEGWDDKTEAKCTVIHFTSKEEVERRIAWTAKMVEPRQAANHSWSFDKIFGDDDFIAAGQLIIPPKGRKPSKAAKDNTYVFYVIEGAVNFKIHDTSMILASGGMFMVPRGNTYFIENICDRDTKLFFTQARKVVMSKDELAARAEKRKSVVRSSSAGATSAKKLQTPNGRALSMAALPVNGT